MELPAAIRDVAHLEELLSEPSDAAIDAMRRRERRRRRARRRRQDGADARAHGATRDRRGRRSRRVIGVSRFSSSGPAAALEPHGIETIRCDLLDEDALARLPDAPNVIFMAGRKFGSTGDESLTWAMNAYLPALVCRRYRSSRIVAFSTGNVYGLTPTWPRRLARGRSALPRSASTR